MKAFNVVGRALAAHLTDWSKEKVLGALSRPPRPELGDVAFACHRLSKELKKGPEEIARELAESVPAGQGVERFEAAGPYLNAFLDRAAFASEVLQEVQAKKGHYGAPEKPAGKKVLVEYSAPNTNKPLHVGHLRNDSIGMSISNILEFTGHEIVRANLLNDRGMSVCKSMVAYQRFAQGQTPEKEGVKGDVFVGNLYVLFNKETKNDPGLQEEAQEMLRKWEAGDKEVRAQWKKLRDWVMEGYKQTYARFGSRFDVWFAESEFYDKAAPIIEEGLKKGVFVKDEEGRTVARLKKVKLPDKVVLRADGTSIYLTNDLALTKHKFEHFNSDTCLWVVASEQDLYFQQLFAIFRLLGYPWAGHAEHINYGLVFLPEGKMKSREGKVLDADDLLDEVEALARKAVQDGARAVGGEELDVRARVIALAAVKFALLKADHRRNMLFEREKSVSFEGDTGPYLLYTYARARSILRKAGFKPGAFDAARLKEDKEHALVRALDAFGDVVEKAVEKRTPHLVAQYALSVAEKFNSFYHTVQVISGEQAARPARLALVAATAQVLHNALDLLNIEALEEM